MDLAFQAGMSDDDGTVFALPQAMNLSSFVAEEIF